MTEDQPRRRRLNGNTIAVLLAVIVMLGGVLALVIVLSILLPRLNDFERRLRAIERDDPRQRQLEEHERVFHGVVIP